MNELHLFAGAGGGILGGMLLGHTCVCAVEIEEYPRKVLLQRQRDGILPRFPIWDDICTFDGRPWRGRVDVVAGGFPCQDISAAGKGAGLAGARSGLWAEMARVISDVRPRFVFVENSPLLVSRGLDVVLCDLAALGYNARWGIVSAANAGAVHKRARVWLLGADADGNRRDSGGGTRRCPPEEGSEYGDNAKRFCRRSRFQDESQFARVVDGVADRLERLNTTGNGQVPAVAALAWRLLGGPVA